MATVYEIKCKANGWSYVGGTSMSLKERYRFHRNKLNAGEERRYAAAFLADWDKYGESGFELVLIETVALEYLTEVEKFWIENTFHCYNPTSTNSGFAGHQHTEEDKIKCGSAHRGKHLSEEHKAKISASVKASWERGRN